MEVSVALSNAQAMDLVIKDWNEKYFVQLESRNPKALESLLVFFLSEILGDAVRVRKLLYSQVARNTLDFCNGRPLEKFKKYF